MDKPVTKAIVDSKRTKSQWFLDRTTKRAFFRQQLYDLLTITAKIEEIRGERLEWDLDMLGISKLAWNKVIHRGIKPIIVFPHTIVLKTIPGSIRYYRMLSMELQDSKSWIRLKADSYESSQALPDGKTTSAIARHLNQIISRMIELDDQINAQEFDLWREMVAGSETEGLWKNTKGKAIKA